MRHHTLVALAAIFFASACTVEVPVEHPERIGTTPTMSRTDSCFETVCDQARREFQDSWACTSCISDCVINGGSYNACHSYCRYTCVLNCDSATSPCASSRYAFQVSAERDESVAGACQIAHEHRDECTDQETTSDCDIIGRTRVPAMRAYYECQARVACDAHSTCAMPAGGSLGDEWSAASEQLCHYGDSTFQLQLNAGQGALRDDVIGALRGCFALSTCDELNRCTRAWRDAVVM